MAVASCACGSLNRWRCSRGFEVGARRSKCWRPIGCASGWPMNCGAHPIGIGWRRTMRGRTTVIDDRDRTILRGIMMEALHVQVRQIDGDLAVLLFNPREADLHVGETLTLHELATGRSVIVQVIAFRSATYPSLVADQLYNLVGPEPVQAPLLDAIGYQLRLPEALTRTRYGAGQHQSGAGENSQDGLRAPRQENGRGAIGNNGTAGFPRARWRSFARPITKCSPIPRATLVIGLRLGRTLAGHDFFIEGQDLEKVNVISGVKGSGKSHLSKVVLLQLIARARRVWSSTSTANTFTCPKPKSIRSRARPCGAASSIWKQAATSA